MRVPQIVRSKTRPIGRPRAQHSTMPSHIDPAKLPRGVYWDRSGLGRWYVKELREDGTRTNRAVAGPMATVADLRQIAESLRGCEYDAVIARIKLKVEHLPPPSSMPPVKVRNRRVRRIAWADQAAVYAFYRRARELSEQTSARHQVDHVIPLVHPLVCGLHVETNLRIVVYEENAAKSNIWAPELG